jgi:tetratricopeptide (TPR) repeat protein
VAAETQAAIAAELIRRNWKIAALFRLRRLLEFLEGSGQKVRAPRAEIDERVQRIRAELGEHRPLVASYDEVATALEKNGRDEGAVEMLEKMRALEPDNPVFHARLAETLCRLGRTEAAIPVFRAAAKSLAEFDRRADALRVLERILFFKNAPEDALAAAELYLERDDEPTDALRAVEKLQICVSADPENLDVLALLARAFDRMDQKQRAVQVRTEMARIARENGETELFRDLMKELAPPANDKSRPGSGSSAPSLSVKSFVSVTDSDIAAIREVLAKTRSNTSVLEDLAFEEISVLSEVWVMPTISKEAQRALEEAETFAKLRLFAKAEYVLRDAIAADPVCSELLDSLRGVLKAKGEMSGFVAETMALADLYNQRRFFARARDLVLEVLEVDPANADAKALAARLPEKAVARGARSASP